MIQSLKSSIREIPKDVFRLIVKALILFLIWKFSYHLFLGPKLILDKPLTNLTAKGTFNFLKIWHGEKNLSWSKMSFNNQKNAWIEARIYVNTEKKLGISDACNALEIFVLYLGFMVCFPTTLKRFLAFASIGIIVIFILNVFRCSGIFWLNLYHNQWVDFAHHYLFKLILYFTVFVGWILYVQTEKSEK
jgi:exosortase/archaeosortase family protein